MITQSRTSNVPSTTDMTTADGGTPSTTQQSQGKTAPPAATSTPPKLVDSTDARTIAAVLGGDRQAYGQLANRYQERLFNSLTYLLQDRAEAEDVVQEALTQAYLKLGTFRQEGSFYTWLYRIAWNIASTRRRRRRREVSLDHFCEASGTEPADEAIDSKDDRDDAIYRVRKAMGDLGERFRTVLVLRHLEGYSYETIADILELPVGTVRSRIHRGRNELRRRLEVHLRPLN